jgi:hypothetical protein
MFIALDVVAGVFVFIGFFLFFLLAVVLPAVVAVSFLIALPLAPFYWLWESGSDAATGWFPEVSIWDVWILLIVFVIACGVIGFISFCLIAALATKKLRSRRAKVAD